MTEEALIMSSDNNNKTSNDIINSSTLNISLPFELSFLNKVPSTTMLNKNVMTNNRKSLVADKPPPVPPTATTAVTTTTTTNTTTNNKDESIFGNCYRNSLQHTSNHFLMNTSYVVSSPISLPSSLSCDASQTSPPSHIVTNLSRIQNKLEDNHHEYMYNNGASSYYPPPTSHPSQSLQQQQQQLQNSKQNYFESLHSYKHYDKEIFNNNNRQPLNKSGQRN
jgi:hypothetical protein